MLVVCFEPAKISSCNSLDRSWELVKMSPEARCCTMHLQILEGAFFFRFKRFGNQEIQLPAF